MTFYTSDSLSHDHFCSWSCLQYAVTAVPVKIRLLSTCSLLQNPDRIAWLFLEALQYCF